MHSNFHFYYYSSNLHILQLPVLQQHPQILVVPHPDGLDDPEAGGEAHVGVHGGVEAAGEALVAVLGELRRRILIFKLVRTAYLAYLTKIVGF